MANPIEAARNYMGSVVKRTFGISAWQETMRRPEIPHIYDSRQPREINPEAVLSFALQFFSPATYSVWFEPFLKKNNTEPLSHLKMTRPMIPTMVIDLTLHSASFILGQNLLGLAAWRLGGNVVIQVGSDLAHRIRGSRPPTATLTV